MNIDNSSTQPMFPLPGTFSLALAKGMTGKQYPSIPLFTVRSLLGPGFRRFLPDPTVPLTPPPPPLRSLGGAGVWFGIRAVGTEIISD